jgi:hypothetical protein
MLENPGDRTRPYLSADIFPRILTGRASTISHVPLAFTIERAALSGWCFRICRQFCFRFVGSQIKAATSSTFSFATASTSFFYHFCRTSNCERCFPSSSIIVIRFRLRARIQHLRDSKRLPRPGLLHCDSGDQVCLVPPPIQTSISAIRTDDRPALGDGRHPHQYRGL